MKKSKKVEPICGNCLLYNNLKHECKVAILNEGEIIHIPVSPQDPCFFETEFTAKTPNGKDEKFTVDIKQVRFFVENEKGEPAEHGTVKVEYPEDLIQ